MKTLLTPKELAEAIGSSESSVRRWVDNGDIRMSRTAGGHRRIPLREAIRFIRQIGVPLLRPELLGLGEFGAEQSWSPGLSDHDKLFESLRSGDRATSKALIISWYVDGQTLAALFDGPVSNALARLGELWSHDPRGILIEHRGTEICIEAIAAIRGLLPTVDETAPLGLGGAPEHDPYQIPSMMVGAVLADAGFEEVNFGPNTPLELLAHEAVERRAKLVWVSISTHQDAAVHRRPVAELAALLARQRIALILGGRYHLEVVPPNLPNVQVADSMTALAKIAGNMISSRATN